MKKLTTIILFTLILIGCSSDYKKFTITDFSKKRIDTLKPYDYKTYSGFYIKVKGYTNDTIKIRGIFKINLSGTIDTIIKGDYYGTENIICVFNPYKAAHGKLNIEYGL